LVEFSVVENGVLTKREK